MRGLNLAVLIVGLTLIGAALYGFAGMDGSLKLAAAHTQPAPQSVLEIGSPPTPPCHDHHGGGDGFTPGV
jgi:hypothetical protein